MRVTLWAVDTSTFRPTVHPESIREIVFGVEDGVVQNMTLIAGMVGAMVSNGVVVLAGSVNAIAGVLSMSMGTYLSSQAEGDALAAAGCDPGVRRSPLRDALVMAAAYGLGGLVPLLPFAIPIFEPAVAIVVAVALTVAALFALGVLKGAVSRQPRVRSGITLLGLALGAGLAGYLIGVLARTVFGLEV